MAIVQISQIQVRRGLQQDLPQLASAEFGWSLDTRQLYIGNGTISEGAPAEGTTEVLTQYSDLLNIGNAYTFKGAQSGYTSQTGLFSTTPITRTLQQKLDDSINVADFGALGDGTTDDTAAIQRAIDQVLFGGFALTLTKLRREIHFPAGLFIISGTLSLPSYVTLIGAGAQRTIIQQNSSAPVLQLKDGSGQTGTSYATNGAATASYVACRYMTLSSSTSKNILNLDSCSDIDFLRVRFVGSQTNSTSTSITGQNAVYAVPTNYALGNINNLQFVDCSFNNCTQGMILNTNNVKIIGCDFTNMSRAITVDTTISAAKTSDIKISSSSFNSIGNQAIYVNASTVGTPVHVNSIGNYYGECGTNYVGSGPVTNVIYFNASSCYSISDSFARTDADNGAYRRVQHVLGSINYTITANSGIQNGMVRTGAGKIVTLSASQTNANTGIVLNGSTHNAFAIRYLLQRPSIPAWRKGELSVIVDTVTNVEYIDEYVEYPNQTSANYFTYPGTTGVTFTVVSLGSGKYALNYTSDSSGTGTFTYNINDIQYS
jgi:hypothetical protein